MRFTIAHGKFPSFSASKDISQQILKDDRGHTATDIANICIGKEAQFAPPTCLQLPSKEVLSLFFFFFLEILPCQLVLGTPAWLKISSLWYSRSRRYIREVVLKPFISWVSNAAWIRCDTYNHPVATYLGLVTESRKLAFLNYFVIIVTH